MLLDSLPSVQLLLQPRAGSTPEPDPRPTFRLLSELGEPQGASVTLQPWIWQSPLCSPLPARLHRRDQRGGWKGRDNAVPHSARP